MNGLITNIQKFSIHDGPGIRTTVFLKGCNLKCFWCHNPETIDPRQQLQIFPTKCIGCGKCIQVCPNVAHQLVEGNKIFSRNKCKACGKCAQVCYAEALVMAARMMTVSETVDEIEKDKAFYDNSGGGVTFSGGEPLLQKEFLKALLTECKRRNIHTAIDSALNIPWEDIEEILPLVDLFMIDVKLMSDEEHRKATGVSNKRINENLAKLVKAKKDIVIRIPVIPGVNDSLEAISEIGDFLKSLQEIKRVELLAYHGMAESKYLSLDMEFKTKGLKPPSESFMKKAKQELEGYGLIVSYQ